MSVEVSFDGLVGPTHNYAGLSFGNIASMEHKNRPSSPKKAALQGLAKMEMMVKLGSPQAVLPPQMRPAIDVLRALGFRGSAHQVIESAAKDAPHIYLNCISSSAMWTANAATVTPSTDSFDGKVHFTPANLINFFHRSIETETTKQLLQTIFADQNHFVVHDALPSVFPFNDEGAANHIRFCKSHGDIGTHLFVFGNQNETKFPARQLLEASKAIARSHGIKNVVFAKQNPEAINAGVFHNGVISTGYKSLYLCHEKSFLDVKQVIGQLEESCKLKTIIVKESEISLQDAVSSYLFNSQIVEVSGQLHLIAPKECFNNKKVRGYIEGLMNKVFQGVTYIDLRESMSNGGGPACLRLRVVLSEKELRCVNPGVMLNLEKIEILKGWVNRHYRDTLSVQDLFDVKLYDESLAALTELYDLLDLRGQA